MSRQSFASHLCINSIDYAIAIYICRKEPEISLFYEIMTVKSGKRSFTNGANLSSCTGWPGSGGFSFTDHFSAYRFREYLPLPLTHLRSFF